MIENKQNLKSLLVAKVWGQDLQTQSSDPQLRGSPSSGLAKLIPKFSHNEQDNIKISKREEKDAKLLILTCDYLAILDALEAGSDSGSKKAIDGSLSGTITYSLPLSRITNVTSNENEVVVDYIASNLSGHNMQERSGSMRKRQSSSSGAIEFHKTIFGALTSNPVFKSFGSGSRVQNNSISQYQDEDVLNITERLIMETPRDAALLVQQVNNAVSRMSDAVKWLDAGLPLLKSPQLFSVSLIPADKVDRDDVHTKVTLVELPRPSETFHLVTQKSEMEGCSLKFLVGGPVGACSAVMSMKEVRSKLQSGESGYITVRTTCEGLESREGNDDTRKEENLPVFSVDVEFKVRELTEPEIAEEESGIRRIGVEGKYVAPVSALCLALLIPVVKNILFTAFICILFCGLLLLFLSSISVQILVLSKVARMHYEFEYIGCTLVEEAKEVVLKEAEDDALVEQTTSSKRLVPFASMQRVQETGPMNLNRTSIRRSVFTSSIDGHIEMEIDIASISIIAESGEITHEEADAIRKLHAVSPAVNIDLFRRYVAACKGDRKHALQRLRATAEWRREHNVDTILDSPIPHFKLLKASYVHAVVGRTRSGMPVVVEGMGAFRSTMAILRKKGLVPSKQEEVIHQFVFVIEWITRVLDATSFPKGKFVRIYDMKGIGFSDIADSEAVHLGKQMMDVLEQFYPERMAKAYVVNVPGFFGAVWRVIKPMLDPNTAKKINVITKFKHIVPALQEEMDLEVIPKMYGGKGVENLYDTPEEKEIFALADRVNSEERI